jgi:hypothetical protein
MRLYLCLVRLFVGAGMLFGIVLGILLGISTDLATGIAWGFSSGLLLTLGVPALLLVMGRKNRVAAS